MIGLKPGLRAGKWTNVMAEKYVERYEGRKWTITLAEMFRGMKI